MGGKMIKLLIGGSPCTYWKDVVGYEGIYQVSDTGKVKRVGKKELKPKIEKNGYVRFHLSKNGIAKMELAHRLVAQAFIPNPLNYKTVNHIDENKQNNCVSNLEWCDMTYQNRYGQGAINRNKAKEKPVFQFDKNGNFIKKFDSVKIAAQELNLSESSIHCVCKKQRRYKSTGGYVFAYEKGDDVL